ncbi:MAG: hypothetical protein IKR47_06875 [Lachnospiraceae bacterium]|nr:hypothetical protein [Lachnospiraceae bacterium]
MVKSPPEMYTIGVITGTKRKLEANDENKRKREEIQKLFRENYRETITFDNKDIVRSYTADKAFEQYDLNCEPADWAREIMTILEQTLKVNKDE